MLSIGVWCHSKPVFVARVKLLRRTAHRRPGINSRWPHNDVVLRAALPGGGRSPAGACPVQSARCGLVQPDLVARTFGRGVSRAWPSAMANHGTGSGGDISRARPWAVANDGHRLRRCGLQRPQFSGGRSRAPAPAVWFVVATLRRCHLVGAALCGLIWWPAPWAVWFHWCQLRQWHCAWSTSRRWYLTGQRFACDVCQAWPWAVRFAVATLRR